MLKLQNYNIILPKYLEIVKGKGSSLIFSASGGWDKEKNCKPAEKIAVGSEGEAEGGCGENSAAPERIQKEASPAALLVQSRTPKKSFVFLLEEKIGRAQYQKCRENFFAGWRASARGGGAASLVGFPFVVGSRKVYNYSTYIKHWHMPVFYIGAGGIRRLTMVFYGSNM